MKQEEVKKHLKLSKNAASFYDPVSKIKVLPGQVVTVSDLAIGRSPHLRMAIAKQYLIETDAPASTVEAVEDEETDTKAPSEKDLEKARAKEEAQMKKELLQQIQDEFDIPKEEVKELKAKSLEELQAYYADINQ